MDHKIKKIMMELKQFCINSHELEIHPCGDCPMFPICCANRSVEDIEVKIEVPNE